MEGDMKGQKWSMIRYFTCSLHQKFIPTLQKDYLIFPFIQPFIQPFTSLHFPSLPFRWPFKQVKGRFLAHGGKTFCFFVYKKSAVVRKLGGGFGFYPNSDSAEFGCFENRSFYFRARAFFSNEKKKLVTFPIKNFYRYIGSTLHNDVIHRIIF